MLAKSTSTIYFLLSVLIVFALSSGIARAEISSTVSHITTAESLHISYCDLTFGSAKQDESGCCEPGGICFEKQCCSHGHASGTAVVETQPRSYEAPFRDEMAVSKTALYTSADMHSHYRPPIA
ncbi:MAG: hypothetical protein AAGK13_08865 [Pseudomonadota bacterium]|uniref:hypothetical protein n=1 Tax=Vibrio campbellii TaxID=680 RepID=UPI000D3FC325|nr:hypothetical protein [Vibrio campbellii]MCC4226002.1 hypothetical protein [Vibrio campbellii]PQJ39274.1 hypothetical protein BTN99_20835 [Vibrio campbellii]